MQEIKNFNCDGDYRMCCEEFCSNKYTNIEMILLNGFSICLTLCEKHAEEWANKVKEVEEDIAKVWIDYCKRRGATNGIKI